MRIRTRLTGRTGVIAEVGLGVTLATALAVQASALAVTWGGHYWVFGCATGLLVSVIALVRRRDLAWAAVAGLAVAAVAVLATRLAQLPAEPGPAMALGLAVLVGSAIRTLPLLTAGAVAAGGLAVVVGGKLAFPSSAAPVWNGMGWLAALAVGLGLRLLETRRRAMVEKVRRDERLELARELHDVVAHHVTGIVLETQAARIVARKHSEQLDDSLAGIETAGSDALTAMRRVVGLLRDTDDAAPATLGHEQLSDLVKRFSGHGPSVRLRLPDDDSAWPPEVTSTVYRVVRESLTNIVRHAPNATSVTVSIAQDREAVTVEVVDDGPPTPTRSRHRGGFGLIGMRERVEALGGALITGPRSGAGWSVLATLPAPARERV